MENDEELKPKKFTVYEYIVIPEKGHRFFRENDGKDYTKNHTGRVIAKIIFETSIKREAVKLTKELGDVADPAEVKAYYQHRYP
jgi:hypothetical protein